MPTLEEKLVEKEKQLAELKLEYQANKQVLSENWNQAVSEARKQYEAIDTALEVNVCSKLTAYGDLLIN